MPRRLITVQGIVQGVGFRPFVYRLATARQLTGLVANTGSGVRIEAQGPDEALAGFTRALQNEAPPHAALTGIKETGLPLNEAETGFCILPSEPDGGPATTLVAPDLCTCDDCLGELFDPQDRRYRYPFINCTNCGPRFTIITAIPYDRAATTMRTFDMCPECRREYEDPANRRFHAQPNACPACGPKVWLCGPDGAAIPAGEIFSRSASLLKQGLILAVKGLGGFHLAVDPTHATAVAELRRRKGRPHKPLALMVAAIEEAKALGHLSPAACDLLLSPQRPIVLVPKRAEAAISPEVAPGVNELGLMLPYTPIHHLLLNAFGGPLVMTSANLSDEPLCRENREALARLKGVADFFLLNDREITALADDSVVIPGPDHHRPHPVRRGRGLAPAPIPLAETGPQVLAVGGEMKNTVCLAKDDLALVSPHLGDLKNPAIPPLFTDSIRHLLDIFDGRPELIVCDLHPDYLSSQWARRAAAGRPVLAVQHHHAHLVSCLAENRHPGPAIGVILDGTGLGDDGGIWGGEVLIGSAYGYTRYAHLEPMPLPGADRAIREPWRTAVGYLVQTFGPSLPELDFLSLNDWRPVAEISTRPRLAPPTTSCGRLFDAIAALCGLRQVISYEGQAAIELMAAAGRGPLTDSGYDLDLTELAATRIIPVRPLIRQVVADLKRGAAPGAISRRLHATLIQMLSCAVRLAAADCGLATVALSGGVFANSLLREGLSCVLSQEGFTVLNHSLLPAGDGGLSLGQAMIGRAHLARHGV